MSKAEKSPILVTLESQLPQERKPPTYGVVEIGISQEPPPQKWISGKGGMASTSAVAIAGIIVGIVLIFGLVQWSSPNPENNLVLKQENPVPADHVDITIPQGRLRGYVRNSREGREYAAFYKVPYAKPPLGKLRFKVTEIESIIPFTSLNLKVLRSIFIGRILNHRQAGQVFVTSHRLDLSVFNTKSIPHHPTLSTPRAKRIVSAPIFMFPTLVLFVQLQLIR